MTTLIAVYNSSGCIGRCDAKCYDAQSADCDCICGGANHGAGQEAAIDNTRDMAEQWLEDYKRENGLTKCRDFINREVVDQISLFDLSNLHTKVRKTA